MAGVRAELIRDGESLCALEGEWWALWRRSPATPFQSPAWLLPWWNTFHPGELLSVAVREGSRLVALAPLYIEEGPSGRRLLPIGIALSDYLDVILEASAPDAGTALVEELEGASGWDLLSLEDLPPSASALSLPCSRAWRERREAQQPCPVLHLPESVARLRECIPPERLRKLRTARHRADRAGGASVERIAAADTLRFLDHLFRLNGTRWESRGESGVAADPRVQEFHAAAAPRLLAAGLARFALLILRERIVAAYYGLCDRGKAFGYLTGFDPEFAFESPGALLLGQIIEDAVGEGCREFHFLRGRERYKYDWGAVDAWSTQRVFVRNGAHA